MIRVGCCGWPVGRRQYAAVFDLVEVQQSFYNLPRLATTERWRREMPPGFEFVLKAPQLITHDPSSPTYRKLRVPLTEAQKTRYGRSADAGGPGGVDPDAGAGPGARLAPGAVPVSGLIHADRRAPPRLHRLL